MSLGALLFARADFDRYYNCSAYDVDEIPLAKRRSIPIAIFVWSVGVLFEALYLPCVWAIYRLIHSSRMPTCYPLMCYLGVVDCFELMCSTFVVGYLCAIGGVYCSAPIIDYVACMLGMAGWFAGNTTVVILALNRCVVIIRPEFNDKLFKGRAKLITWMAVPTLGAVVFVFLVPPVMFNSVTATTYLNPHMFYLPDQAYYHNIVHTSYNYFIVGAILVCYTVFLGHLLRKLWSGRVARAAGGAATRPKASRGEAYRIRSETKATVQIFITCSFVLFTALGFIYTEKLNQFGFLVLFAYITYEGSPALVYLSMNRQIRRRVLQLFQKSKISPGSQPSNTGYATQVATTNLNTNAIANTRKS